MIHVFLLCSGLAALINLVVGYLLYSTVGLDSQIGYAVSISLAFLVGMTVSFVLNRQFTYAPSGRAPLQELADFLMVSLVGLLLTTSVALLLIRSSRDVMLIVLPTALLPETIAHLCAVAVTAVYSFLAHKHISFRCNGTLWPTGGCPRPQSEKMSDREVGR